MTFSTRCKKSVGNFVYIYYLTCPELYERNDNLKAYRISLIRHGQTVANQKGIYIGSRTDYPLSDFGTAELFNKKEEFEYPRVDKVYSSPLKRCTETAEILFPEKQLCIVDNLRELDFGNFEGKNIRDIINLEEYRDWIKGGISKRPPDGESIEELSARTYKALHEIIMDMMYEDITHSAIITHYGVISNMLAGFGIPKIDPKTLKCPAGEGFEVMVTAKMWQQSQAFEIFGAVPYERIPESEEF